MKYEIYQIEDTRKTKDSFVGWCDPVARDFNFGDYYKVYEGDLPQKNILEELFRIFNVDHPADFRGHSLSVSDIVALKKDGNDYWYWYYCDSFGWKEITEIMAK